ncbi:MAG: M14 family zinc carboxypeptidase [Gemmatimonadaceae bacterium]
MVRFFPVAWLALLALPFTPLRAQHAFAEAGATYDARIPTPRAVLGYELGERFTPHRLMMRYIERVAAVSPRVRVDTVAHTFEGREMLLITVASEANMVRLDAIRADARRVADPRGATPAALEAATARVPAIVWLAHSVHGGEASGAEAGLALLYQLAAGTDRETLMSLDSTVVLIDPNENPDGRERFTHDLERTWSAQGPSVEPGAMNNSGSWPGPRTSHYYFDLNRDWFIQSHPESRGRVQSYLQWWPHVAVDLHEQGSSASFYFAPPREPDNKNNPLHLTRWFDIFAAAHGAAFDTHGWSYFRREGYDSFYPGYGEGWPMLTGSVGMLFESASSGGGVVRRNDGMLRTLRQAAWEHYTAEWATVRTSARRRTELVRDYAKSRSDAIAIHARGPMRAIVFARDEQGRADSLAVKLRENGIEVQRLAGATELRDATMFGATTSAASTRVPAGSYVVDLSQPQGHLAKALLEPDAALDSAFVRLELEMRRTGQRNRFYDVTAWSMPLAYRLQAWWTRSVPSGVTLVTEAPRVAPATVARARYGYAFAPGSEASLRLLASLLKDSVRVWHAPRSFVADGARFPQGAFLVRVAVNRPDVHDVVVAHARAAGATVSGISSAGVSEGTDLGSNSVVPILPPRVALLGGAPVSGGSFGFAWYALDQRMGYPAALVDAGLVSGPGLDRFTVLIVPSVASAALERALGETGRTRLVQWVRDGGVLITIDGATDWLAEEKLGLARTRVTRDSTRADSAGGAPLPASLPGVLARATFDSLSPLMTGVATGELPVFVNSGRVLSVPKDLAAGEAVIRFASADRIRLSGYFWPEVPAKLALSPYLWTERAGRGRVIAFAHDPVYRDLYRGLLPIFANAVLLGATF